MAKREPWGIEFFQRHAGDDPTRAIPGLVFLDSCPIKVRARFDATLTAVADAPPPAFSGGGYWEAMHDDMADFYEIRIDGPKRPNDKGAAPRHYRLFCLLERDGKRVGLDGPSLVVITGLDKAYRTVLSDADYAKVRRLGDEYRARVPRSVER